MATMEQKRVTDIARQLKEIHEGENWLDENFRKKLDSLNDEEVFIRPLPGVHSVAELVSHILAWHLECMRKLKGLDKELTMESPENWRSNEELSKIGWAKLKNDLYESLHDLVRIIENKADSYLDTEYMEGYSYKYLLEGLIQHDAYHLGQIGITIKLLHDR